MTKTIALIALLQASFLLSLVAHADDAASANKAAPSAVTTTNAPANPSTNAKSVAKTDAKDEDCDCKKGHCKMHHHGKKTDANKNSDKS